MKIEVQANGFDPDNKLSHFAMCCAGFELGAQRDQIVSLRVQLAGASELRDGNDQFCFVEIELSDGHKILTKAMDADFHIAIYQALERAGGMVAQRQQREYRHAGRAPNPRVPSLRASNWAA